jgi:hypothetical protein
MEQDRQGFDSPVDVQRFYALGKKRTDACTLVWTAPYGLSDGEVSTSPLM